MTFTYRDKEYKFPDSLHEITLAQRIEFYELHGKVLDTQAEQIAKIESDFDREAESNIWHLEMAVRSFSFFTGIDIEEIRKYVDIDSLLEIYRAQIKPLLEQEQNIDLQTEYEFAGEQWLLAPPQLAANSKMLLNEFIHAKEAVRQINQLGLGKWNTLPYLCAIYLRRRGEEFDESFVVEGSERMELMKTLPLDIAIAVGFFLTSIVRTYTSISLYSAPPQVKESIPESISINGDG